MPRNYRRQNTDYRDAARILRGLYTRVQDLEEGRTDVTELVQLSRQVDEAISVDDDIQVETPDPDGFIWNLSKWDRRDWGNGVTAIPPIQTDDGVLARARAKAIRATEFPNAPLDDERTGSTGQFKTGELHDHITPVLDVAGITTAHAHVRTANDSVTTPGTGGDVEYSVPADAINLNDRGLSEGDTVNDYIHDYQEDMVIESGTYRWDYDGRMTFDGFGVYGTPPLGSVVWEAEGSDGPIRDGPFINGGGWHNIRVTGFGTDNRTGLYANPGAHFTHYVNRGGHSNDKGRHFYADEGGPERTYFENSSWALSGDNGTYVDKYPCTYNYCVADTNNISNIRIGSREGPQPGDTYLNDCVIASTQTATTNNEGQTNVRGVYVRWPIRAHLTRCLWDYTDANPTSSLLQIQDDSQTSWSEVRLSHCVFWNETGSRPINAQWNCPVYIDGPVIVGGPGELDLNADIRDPDNLLEFDSGLSRPTYDYRAVCRQEQSPVAPYFSDVDGDPTTYP